MVFPFGVCLPRWRPVAGVDAYGDPIEVTYNKWPDESVEGCGPYVTSQPEVVSAGRTAVVARLTVIGPVDADWRVGDRTEFEGRVWQAVGVIERTRNPFTGWEPGSQMVFEMVEG